MNEFNFMDSELKRLVLQNKIGAGAGRTVYVCDFVPGLVFKVEDQARSFQNVIEWETWERIRETKLARWFAPCVAISPCGGILVMKRTEPLTHFPDRMPVFFTDFKRANYGELAGEPVCHDYGTNLLMENGMSSRLKKVKWWDL